MMSAWASPATDIMKKAMAAILTTAMTHIMTVITVRALAISALAAVGTIIIIIIRDMAYSCLTAMVADTKCGSNIAAIGAKSGTIRIANIVEGIGTMTVTNGADRDIIMGRRAEPMAGVIGAARARAMARIKGLLHAARAGAAGATERVGVTAGAQMQFSCPIGMV